jgi:hypothetical protein
MVPTRRIGGRASHRVGLLIGLGLLLWLRGPETPIEALGLLLGLGLLIGKTLYVVIVSTHA